MAKRGIFRKIFDRVFGIPEEEPRPPSPPPSPPGGDIREPPDTQRRDKFWDIWNYEVPASKRREITNETGYSNRENEQRHLVLFLSLPGMTEEERSDQYNFWTEYLRAFITGRQDRVHFLHDVGLDPRDFAWDEWRNAMGYRGRK